MEVREALYFSGMDRDHPDESISKRGDPDQIGVDIENTRQ